MQTNHLHTDLFLHGGKIHKNIDIELLKSIKVSKDIDFSDPELIVDYSEDFLDETHDYKPETTNITETPETIKTKYESNADTNVFTDAEKTKLAELDSSKWEPDPTANYTIAAATEVHPRWDESPDPSVYGLDTFKLNLLPAGSRGLAGSYAQLGRFGYLWTSTTSGTSKAWMYTGLYHDDFLSRSDVNKRTGNSIRLVRNYSIADGEKTDGRILTGAFTDFDGNIYDGVIIGEQVWSTINLKTTTYLDGTAIPGNYSNTDWQTLSTDAYTVYPYTSVIGINSEQEMVDAYGLLYNWYVVDDVRGLSSEGHVPTDEEFTQLTDYLITTYPDITADNVGDHLKSTRQVNSPYVVNDKNIMRLKDGKKFKISQISDLPPIPSKTSELINDAKFVTESNLPKYPIEDGISWDGTPHTIDMSASKQYTLNVANGTTSLIFGFENCTDQVKDVIVRINNSLNSAVIHTIVFNGDWKFSIGDPITGLAPNTNFELIVRNISLTQVKGITDVES